MTRSASWLRDGGKNETGVGRIAGPPPSSLAMYDRKSLHWALRERTTAEPMPVRP